MNINSVRYSESKISIDYIGTKWRSREIAVCHPRIRYPSAAARWPTSRGRPCRVIPILCTRNWRHRRIRYFHVAVPATGVSEFPLFHLLKIPTDPYGGSVKARPASLARSGVQVLFPGSPWWRRRRRASSRRGASRRRVSGASVDVRDARYFKFHPGQRGALPAISFPPFSLLFPFCWFFFSSAMLHLPLKCHRLILEVRTCGLQRISSYCISSILRSPYFTGIIGASARQYSALPIIKIPFIVTLK